MTQSIKPGRLVISLDFELFWGVRDHRRLEDYGDAILGVRRAVPAMLDLFAEYNVHATWATVGFLFCQSKDELLAHLPQRIPAYHDLNLSPYAHIGRIGEDEKEDPYHYAPSLIGQILDTPGQEIASHTFSHYYCLETGQDLHDFEADLQAAIAIARRRGIILRSLVFPRNQFRNDYLGVCRRLGISAFRGNPPAWPYQAHDGRGNTLMRRATRALDSVLPIMGNQCVSPATPLNRTPVNIPATRFLRPLAGRRPWLSALQRSRIFAELDYTARTGSVFHLWWHPHNFGRHLRPRLDELRKILERFDGWRRLGRMQSVAMHEIVAGPHRDDHNHDEIQRGDRAHG